MFTPSLNKPDASPAITAAAFGRVNLIGEHTDYHQGYVLPMPVPRRTVITVKRRGGYVVRASSANVVPAVAEYELGDESRVGGWIDYVQGVTYVIAKSGRSLVGFDVAIDSNVPPGGGVSSSAALTVALLRALRAMCRFDLGDIEIAHLAQKVETEFIGAPIGIMDQMACSVGRPDEALFLDTRSLHFERLPWPSQIGLVVINSGLVHAHAGGEYATRRRESFAAAALLGVRWLRDANVKSLECSGLPEPQRRRARHVVTENQRVLDAVAALRNCDPYRLGELFNASHRSMRDDYETSTPEIDTLVEIGQADDDIYGARLTGGGFGGSVVMLAHAGRARNAAERIVAEYRKKTGLPGSVMVPEISGASAFRRM
jgi:galactokinase